MKITPDNVATLAPKQALKISHRKRTLTAEIVLASGNGYSLALAFEGILAGYVGMMPVLWDPAANAYREISTAGEAIELATREENNA